MTKDLPAKQRPGSESHRKGGLNTKVLLVSPRREQLKAGTGRSLLPPLALLTVAGLTPGEVEIQLVDEAVTPLDLDARVDLVGISINTASAPRGYEVAAAFRQRGVPVVLGGIHATALPHEASQHCDAVVVGEAEETWPRLLSDFRTGRLQKFYRSSGFPDLAGCPPARRDLIDRKAYLLPDSVQTSRGCPFNCSFCSVTSFFGATYRTRRVEDVVEEVRSLPGDFVVFVDDNIMGQPTFARRLFQALTGLGKKWLSQGSLTMLKDEGLLRLAYRSGCRGLLVGFETLSGATLKKLGKGFNIVERYQEAIEKLHHAGIGVIGSFILGLDEDDESVFERTVGFIEKVKLDLAQFSILTPLPGTRLFRELESQGRIIDRDWSHYNGSHVVFRPALMAPERLEEGFHSVLRRAYSIGGIWRRLRGWHRRLALYLAANMAFRGGVRSYLAGLTAGRGSR